MLCRYWPSILCSAKSLKPRIVPAALSILPIGELLKLDSSFTILRPNSCSLLLNIVLSLYRVVSSLSPRRADSKAILRYFVINFRVRSANASPSCFAPTPSILVNMLPATRPCSPTSVRKLRSIASSSPTCFVTRFLASIISCSCSGRVP